LGDGNASACDQVELPIVSAAAILTSIVAIAGEAIIGTFLASLSLAIENGARVTSNQTAASLVHF